MKSCHIKCACVLSRSVLSRKQPRVSKLSRWRPSHVPLLKQGWKYEAPSWTPAGRLGWCWIRGLENNRMKPLNADWWVWPLSFSPGNEARQGSESLGTGQWGKRRERLKDRQVGQKGKREPQLKSHPNRLCVGTHKSWAKSTSHILFVLKTDTRKSPVPATK